MFLVTLLIVPTMTRHLLGLERKQELSVNMNQPRVAYREVGIPLFRPAIHQAKDSLANRGEGTMVRSDTLRHSDCTIVG
jgi:hypothetical protein